MRAALAAAITLYCAAGSAQIASDGTLGTSVSRTGNAWSITAGTRVGGNLFQSFSQFNVNTGERATFSGPAGVQHIVGRVTGPTASSIDGLLRATIPGADLWLINPKGVIFGQHARLDVGGSFYASTADYVKLGASGRVDAANPAASVLTTAAPSAFGFLSGARAPLTVTGSNLAVPVGKRLALAGGDLNLSGALINAPSGDVLLVSAASAGEAAFGASGITWNGAGALGRIELSGSILNASSFEVDGFGPIPGSATGLPAGAIGLRAGDVLLTQSKLQSDNVSGGPGRGIGIGADGDFTMRGGVIFSGTFANAAAGLVSIAAGTVTLTDNATFNTDTDVGTGTGGSIDVSARQITVTGGSQLSARTLAAGAGGDIRINAGELLSVTDFASVSTDAKGTGPGGGIALAAPAIRLLNGGAIASQSDGTGPGGAISVQASHGLTLAGGVISTNTYGPAPGGDVRIAAQGGISVLAGGQIRSETHSSTAGAGAGGSVTANATNILVRDGGFISARSTGVGDAGSISISASEAVRIENQGSIKTVALSADGGNISIRAGQLVYLWDSEITTSVSTDFGKGGNISIDPIFVVLDHGQIIAQAAKGQGGNISIVSDFFLNFDSLVDASSQTGISGSVQIAAPKTDVSSGLVTLNANYLDASRLIRASCAARAARGGSSMIGVGRGGLPQALFPYGVSALASPGEMRSSNAPLTSNYPYIGCGQAGSAG